MFKIIYNNILNIKTEYMVNASNGVGFMGGFLARYIKMHGLAEYLNFKTKGKIEKEAKKECRKNLKFPFRIFNHSKAGDIFITNSYLDNCKFICHAVTMTYPGTKSSLEVIDNLCCEIADFCRAKQITSITIPLLGCGVGRLKEEDVLNIYRKRFVNCKTEIIIVINKEEPN